MKFSRTETSTSLDQRSRYGLDSRFSLLRNVVCFMTAETFPRFLNAMFLFFKVFTARDVDTN